MAADLDSLECVQLWEVAIDKCAGQLAQLLFVSKADVVARGGLVLPAWSLIRFIEWWIPLYDLSMTHVGGWHQALAKLHAAIAELQQQLVEAQTAHGAAIKRCTATSVCKCWSSHVHVTGLESQLSTLTDQMETVQSEALSAIKKIMTDDPKHGWGVESPYSGCGPQSANGSFPPINSASLNRVIGLCSEIQEAEETKGMDRVHSMVGVLDVGLMQKDNGERLSKPTEELFEQLADIMFSVLPLCSGSDYLMMPRNAFNALKERAAKPGSRFQLSADPRLDCDLQIASEFAKPDLDPDDCVDECDVWEMIDTKTQDKALVFPGPQGGTNAFVCFKMSPRVRAERTKEIARTDAKVMFAVARKKCSDYGLVEHVREQYRGDDGAGTARAMKVTGCINRPSDPKQYADFNPEYFGQFICCNGAAKLQAKYLWKHYQAYMAKNEECVESWDQWQEVSEQCWLLWLADLYAARSKNSMLKNEPRLVGRTVLIPNAGESFCRLPLLSLHCLLCRPTHCTL